MGYETSIGVLLGMHKSFGIRLSYGMVGAEDSQHGNSLRKEPGGVAAREREAHGAGDTGTAWADR